VWTMLAQHQRPGGTAQERVVLPVDRATVLPDAASYDVGAALGVPAVTAHRALTTSEDGPDRLAPGALDGMTVLVAGGAGAVGNAAIQLARWAGATVIGTVVRQSDVARVDRGIASPVALEDPDAIGAIRALAPEGVHRIVEVAFSDNADLDAAVAAPAGVIAAYASRGDRPELPFWPMLFANLTIRLLGSDDFPPAAKRAAAADLTAAARDGALSIPIGDPLPLDRIAEAHDRVEAGTRERVLVAIPS
jgi:NADPH:quinone reductase